jgi:hypothetical protein
VFWRGLPLAEPIEVNNMAENEPCVISAVIPQRGHSPNATSFTAENQPKKRGRPKGSPNKMTPAFKQALVEVAEEVGRVDRKDWEKLLCGDDDGQKGYLKFLAIREPRVFGMLLYRALPTPSRATVRRRPLEEG